MTAVPVAAPRGPAARLVQPLPECATWAVSPYQRCPYRCAYCITGVQGAVQARGNPAEVLGWLREDLGRLGTDVSLAVGALCDAYPPIEAEAGLTRLVLGELHRQGRRFSVITKGTLVTRDLDLLSAEPVSQVTVSLSSLEDRALARFEPETPSAQARLEVVAALTAAGVSAALSITPWIPGVSDAPAIAAAVRALAGPNVWVLAGPLNVRAPAVAGSHFARTWDQAAVNQAYGRARAEADGLKITWLPEVPLDGHHATVLHERLDSCR
jgi:DNA repair photolyase